ncbi:Protein CBG04859 [Caenorhabditis briggsae]|uniref:Protein CBG04859 n=1 Tax=Caenorhabditis briggsae TaxID=6238 RepID=A8WYN0_CAEBR|nr:Protein CBG04859 [Caenorhabditis briggsae]CAP25488.1 Protein CBG04859 [Caenorhabditis briggsae]
MNLAGWASNGGGLLLEEIRYTRIKIFEFLVLKKMFGIPRMISELGYFLNLAQKFRCPSHIRQVKYGVKKFCRDNFITMNISKHARLLGKQLSGQPLLFAMLTCAEMSSTETLKKRLCSKINISLEQCYIIIRISSHFPKNYFHSWHYQKIIIETSTKKNTSTTEEYEYDDENDDSEGEEYYESREHNDDTFGNDLAQIMKH